MIPQHGEVWLADLGMAAKVRPVIVLLSNSVEAPRTLIIHIPITTQSRGGPLEIPLGHLSFLTRESVANVQGVGALPRARFESLAKVKRALCLACDLPKGA